MTKKNEDTKPTIVVGDIHGVYEIVDAVLALDQPVVFIGDYLDSFDRSIEDQFTALTKILRAAKDGRVVALMGNHELSYLEEPMRTSGYNVALHAKLASDFDDTMTVSRAMRTYLKSYHFAEGFLISHAGVSEDLLRREGITLKQYLDDGKFSDIGYARGGRSPVGGLYWCDWDREFDPIPEQPQIVGHSRRVNRIIEAKGNSFCIDVLEHNNPLKTVAEIKDGGLTERKVDTTPFITSTSARYPQYLDIIDRRDAMMKGEL